MTGATDLEIGDAVLIEGLQDGPWVIDNLDDHEAARIRNSVTGRILYVPLLWLVPAVETAP